MKFLKFAFAALATVAFGNAYALHDGGVAHCDACHTMHNSSNGLPTNTGGTVGSAPGAYLLKGSTASDTCLNCHEEEVAAPGLGVSYGKTVSTAPNNWTAAGNLPITRGPAGDFGWLKVSHGGTTTGMQFGHNIIAPDHGYTTGDTLKTLNKAPGGEYPTSALQCSSCHDPHGTYRITDLAAGTVARGGQLTKSVLPIAASSSTAPKITAPPAGTGTTVALGTYRLLAGAGYSPKSLAKAGLSGLEFANQVPMIVAPATYNVSEDTAAREVFVAYGYGTAEWCSNCHAAMHKTFVSGDAGMTHPAGTDAKLAGLAANYNAYVKSGDLTGDGTTTGGASSLVPVEQGIQNLTTLAGMAGQGPTAKAKFMATADNTVTCLSCHRAHATGFKSMTRFPTTATFFTDGTATGAYAKSATTGLGVDGLTPAAIQAALYDRPAANFGIYARSLCNKCHAKD